MMNDHGCDDRKDWKAADAAAVHQGLEGACDAARDRDI
jgi:hypothetical protein